MRPRGECCGEHGSVTTSPSASPVRLAQRESRFTRAHRSPNRTPPASANTTAPRQNHQPIGAEMRLAVGEYRQAKKAPTPATRRAFAVPSIRVVNFPSDHVPHHLAVTQIALLVQSSTENRAPMSLSDSVVPARTRHAFARLRERQRREQSRRSSPTTTTRSSSSSPNASLAPRAALGAPRAALRRAPLYLFRPLRIGRFVPSPPRSLIAHVDDENPGGFVRASASFFTRPRRAGRAVPKIFCRREHRGPPRVLEIIVTERASYTPRAGVIDLDAVPRALVFLAAAPAALPRRRRSPPRAPRRRPRARRASASLDRSRHARPARV